MVGTKGCNFKKFKGTFKSPIIGILTVPVSKVKRSHNDNIKSYLADSYVKWVEMSGARVVPIPYNLPIKELKCILRQINGVLFPGGDVDRVYTEDFYTYIKAFKEIYKYAKSQSHFPLWATCLGFEFLMLMPNNSVKQIYEGYTKLSHINIVQARHQTAPITLRIKSSFNNNMFSHFGKTDYKLFKNNCIYMNHGYGFLTSNPHLSNDVNILSTNLDAREQEYVSTIQFKKHPFYGVQWHPEKVMFEFLDPKIPHDEFSQYISRRMSQMFVDECQKNSNTLENDELLIYYYNLYSRREVLDIIDPKHGKDTKNKSIFEQSYFFK